jgi:hypothetical protein
VPAMANSRWIDPPIRHHPSTLLREVGSLFSLQK